MKTIFPNESFSVDSTRFDQAFECSLAAEYLHDIMQDSLGYDDSSSAYVAETEFINIDSLWMSYKWNEPDNNCVGKSLGLNHYRIVLASLKDSTASDSCIILVAHYDSDNDEHSQDKCQIAPGAFDGAAGVSAIIEMARVIIGSIEEYNFSYKLKFILFPSHESSGFPNWGSRYYVAKYIQSSPDATDKSIKAVMGIANYGIIDTDENRDISIIFSEGDTIGPWKQVAPFNIDLCNLWACGLGKFAYLDSMQFVHSINGDDSAPFQHTGNLNLGLWEPYDTYKACRGMDIYGFPGDSDNHEKKVYLHCDGDTLGNLDKPYFADESKGTLGALLCLALDISIPDQSIGITALTSKLRGSVDWNDTLAVGDTMYFRNDLINHTDDEETGDLWTTIKNVNSNQITVGVVFEDRTLEEWEKRLVYLKEIEDMPDSVGSYEFAARIGEYSANAPEQCLDSDSFDFFVVD